MDQRHFGFDLPLHLLKTKTEEVSVFSRAATTVG
jgi:hypothetical protein